VVHGRVIPFLRPLGRALERPVQLPEDSPHVPGVVADPRHALDDHRDARQRPEVGREAGGDRPAPQGGLDRGQLARRQPRFAPGPAGGLQAGSAARTPRVIPPHDALATDLEQPRDRTLRLLPAGEEARCVLPPKLQGAYSDAS